MTHVEAGSWPRVPLGTMLTDVQPGFACGRHNSLGEGIPHFRPMNVTSEGRIDRSNLKFVNSSEGRAALRLRNGDVLFNNTNSPELVGKTALFVDEDAPAFSNHMTRLRVDTAKLDSAFLAVRLHQAWREGWFATHCNNHVSQASISREVLQTFEFEVPPLQIQRAIAQLSQAVDGKRGSCKEHLEAARRAVERSRQAVLVAACSGRLSADWRELHDVGSELPGLLARLRRERASAGKGRTKVARDPYEAHSLPALPASWKWIAADAACSLITKGTTPSSDLMTRGAGEIPYLKVYNLTFTGEINFSFNPTFIPRATHVGPLKRSRVISGDVLMNIVGPPLGKVSVVPDDYAEWNINQAIAVFRPLPAVRSDFLGLCLLSPLIVGAATRRAKATAGQYNLTLEICREIALPLPPPSEQAEIAHRVDSLIQLLDAVDRRLQAADHEIARSGQAVLAKAFRGEVTSTFADV